MTQLILPQMVERKRGLIINVSTGISRIPIATFNIYGASKAFIDYFTQALSYEYEDKGITVQVKIKSVIKILKSLLFWGMIRISIVV